MQKEEKRFRERQHHLDLLRAIACLSVVMIHVSAEFVVRGSAGPDFWVGNLLDSLSRAGVPLFVMISGALMLDEGYEFTKKKWLGHIGRMAAFYAVWSVVFDLIGSPDYHLWFVPMIIGLYLLVPLIRLWVREENLRSVKYFLALAGVFSFVLPQALDMIGRAVGVPGDIRTFLDNMHLKYTAGYTGYFVLGWYLNRSARRPGVACGLAALGVCLTFAGTGFATAVWGMNDYPFYENLTINVFLHSAGLFVLCRSAFAQPVNAAGIGWKLIRGIGRYSLGIYAVHLYVLAQLLPVFGRMHAAAAIPLVFVLTAGLSAVVSIILNKLPLLKKIA